MSSLALMRWLESAPHRYDAGMRWLTLGRVSRLHEWLAEAAAESEGGALERIDRLTASLAGIFDDWASAGRLLSELRTR